MTWLRIDDGFAGHPKIIAAGIGGLVLQIRALCFSGRYNTDGFIPASQLPSLVINLPLPDLLNPSQASQGSQPGWTPAGWARWMVQCKLWEETKDGFRIHDFLDFNFSKDEVTEHRSRITERQIKAGKARAASAPRRPDGRFIRPNSSSIADQTHSDDVSQFNASLNDQAGVNRPSISASLDQPNAILFQPSSSLDQPNALARLDQPSQPSQPPSTSSSFELLPPISPKGDFLPSTPPPIAKDPLNGHGSGNGHRPRRQATAAFKQDAVELLAWLNQQAGSDFRPLEADGRPSKSLELIMARLRSGIPMFQLRLMISRQVKAWQGDPEMAQYLRPATLFNRTKCEQYVGQLKTAAAGVPDPYAKFPR